ncbi:TATA box-binding protein-associated factor RNA polymerase I subunit B [Euphorbia lathyris]|uniref:TATA box-binding protein-associated factor RNA polymerase I subunit B n=1 Tax=Euphorbia lathyris TaxID=212925 RepID=UPI0033134CEB
MERGQEDLRCGRCGHAGRDESDDGFYYCRGCGAQVDIVTGDDYFLMDSNTHHFTRYSQPATAIEVNPSPQTCFRRYTQEEDNINATNSKAKKEKDDCFPINQYLDGIGSTEPDDFGSAASRKLSYEDYYNEVRIRYVMGMQWMIQMQCEALVEKFNARPLICGLASTVWLRFLASTGVFRDCWADDVLLESEAQRQRELEERRLDPRHGNEPRNAYGQRAVVLWFKHLREIVPLSCSLAISFLACHLAREAILPTDILKWSIEGKLPYFSAHVEIVKRFEFSSPACHINPSLMFRPSQTVAVQRLEKMAATIAESIGLHLPPVNFYEIASRYLKKLSVSVERVLPHACRIYEWSMPPDLWLSANELRLPTRVCVMSILIVAIRILYNINGFGVWERSLSNRHCSPSSSPHTNKLGSTSISETQSGAEKVPGYPHQTVDDSSRDYLGIPSQLDSTDLLNHLEATYNEIGARCEFTKDLPSYLEYCKDVVFAGEGSSHVDHNEQELIERLWDIYQNAKESEMEEEEEEEGAGKQSSSGFKEKKKKHEQWVESPCGNINSEWEEKGIRRLKIDMEENRFYYIPPRVKVKKLDYLHYVRKKDDGALSYAAHADYYILLRACARVAEVDIRNMHNGVLSFERRLGWLENRIHCCLRFMLPTLTCDFCRVMSDDHPID